MIINNITSLINDMIITLYSYDIKFYQILIGLFIFNFIIWKIRYIVKNMSL